MVAETAKFILGPSRKTFFLYHWTQFPFFDRGDGLTIHESADDKKNPFIPSLLKCKLGLEISRSRSSLFTGFELGIGFVEASQRPRREIDQIQFSRGVKKARGSNQWPCSIFEPGKSPLSLYPGSLVSSRVCRLSARDSVSNSKVPIG